MSFIQIIYSDELSEGLPEENQDETSTLLDDTDGMFISLKFCT